MNAFNDSVIISRLRETFGYENFRDQQNKIIENILNGYNTLVMMSTGSGKSLCYQMPAIIHDGMAIVVSPLISLMKNQVDYLQSLEIRAEIINSSVKRKDLESIKDDISNNKIKLLYTAPESLAKEETIAFLSQNAKLSFIAIDEAHCISEWGHDFRPEYRNLKDTIKRLGNLPIIALTATATTRVQLDIMQNLGIYNAKIFKTSFNRANLFYEVQPKIDVHRRIIKFIREHPKQSGIIYCQNRKQVEEVSSFLNVNSIKAVPYHAGLDSKSRICNQDDFLSGKINIIVATIAFGMGIDKSDVRFIIHHDVPRSLEGYYQETGRVGRDGLASTCILFYNPNDLLKLKKLNKSKPDADREKSNLLLCEVGNYVLSGICRRKYLLHYFDEEYNSPCNFCDNCKNPTETYSGKKYIDIVLEAVKQTHEECIIDHIIQIIIGVENSFTTEYKYNTLPIFGKGKGNDEVFWRSVIKQTQLMGFLTMDATKVDVLKLVYDKNDVISIPDNIMLHKNNDYKFIDEPKTTNHDENNDFDLVLFKALCSIRDEIAKERSIPKYAVLDIPSIKDMATYYPTTTEELAKISGCSFNKAKKFGAPFLKVIKSYVEDNNISVVNEFTIRSTGSIAKDKVYIIQQIDRKVELDEIAAARDMSMPDLIKEMEQICYSGMHLNINYYIDQILDSEQRKEIYQYFMNSNTDEIEEAQRILGPEYKENEIRLIRIKFISEVAN